MSVFLKAAGIGGTILAILALVIVFLKQIIAFIGLLTVIIKVAIVLIFIAVFLGIALMIYRTWSERQKAKK